MASPDVKWLEELDQDKVIVKLDQVGDELEGVVLGEREGRWGQLWDIEQRGGGIHSLSDNKILREKLPRRLGQVVVIRLAELQPKPGSKAFKKYKVIPAAVDATTYLGRSPALPTEAPVAPAAPARATAAPTDDDLPF